MEPREGRSQGILSVSGCISRSFDSTSPQRICPPSTPAPAGCPGPWAQSLHLLPLSLQPLGLLIGSSWLWGWLTVLCLPFLLFQYYWKWFQYYYNCALLLCTKLSPPAPPPQLDTEPEHLRLTKWGDMAIYLYCGQEWTRNCCKKFWQAVWEYVPRALKTCVFLPYLLEIQVKIFMNEMMCHWDLVQNNTGERITGAFYRCTEIGHKLRVV